MARLSPVELANWMALYAATGILAMIAGFLAFGMLAGQLYREQAWRRIDGVRTAALFVPQTWWRWQKLYLRSTPVTMAIVMFFGSSMSWS